MPDFVVVSDPQKRTLKQLCNVLDCRIPMILSATAYWGFADKYVGDKYLVFEEGPATDVVKLSEDLPILKTGGTVTSLAIEAAIFLGAEELDLIGVDLAFPNLISHASGTMDCKKVDTTTLIQVENTRGGIVYTNKIMKSYIADIEGQIANHKNVKFYNLSKTGAKIRGAYER